MKPSPMITSPLMRRWITRAHDLLDDIAGVAAVEFAILAPALLAMLLGMFSFGIAMRDYMILTNAATQVALTVALSRGTTSPYDKLVGVVQTAVIPVAFTAATSTLTTPPTWPAGVTITIDGVACNSNASCITNLVAGRSALVTATYPCTLSVMGINYKPGGCTLTASTAQMIQ